MKHLIMQFSPAFHYFISLKPKYSPKQTVLRHPQCGLHETHHSNVHTAPNMDRNSMLNSNVTYISSRALFTSVL